MWRLPLITMNTSPLQLKHYFVSDLHFTINRQFDGGKPVAILGEQFSAESNILQTDQNKQQWQITLRLLHQTAIGINTPYSFSLEIVGLFEVAAGFPADRTEQLVKTNGSSMLFGAAREIIRDVTVRGPYPGVLLPSISFIEAPKKQA